EIDKQGTEVRGIPVRGVGELMRHGLDAGILDVEEDLYFMQVALEVVEVVTEFMFLPLDVRIEHLSDNGSVGDKGIRFEGLVVDAEPHLPVEDEQRIFLEQRMLDGFLPAL